MLWVDARWIVTAMTSELIVRDCAHEKSVRNAMGPLVFPAVNEITVAATGKASAPFPTTVSALRNMSGP